VVASALHLLTEVSDKDVTEYQPQYPPSKRAGHQLDLPVLVTALEPIGPANFPPNLSSTYLFHTSLMWLKEPYG